MTRSGKACAKAMTIMNEQERSQRNEQAALAIRPKIIGARIKRTEDPRLLTGRGAYTDDRKVPNVLHVAFRRSDHSHALIRSIDTAQAKQAPGVIGVFTAEDMAEVAAVFATSRMKDYHATPIGAVARGKARFAGEAIRGVVARTRYLAEDAVELIQIEFAPLPVVIDPEEAIKPD